MFVHTALDTRYLSRWSSFIPQMLLRDNHFFSKSNETKGVHTTSKMRNKGTSSRGGSNRDNRSLLGLPTRNSDLSNVDEEMLENQNDQDLDNLAATTAKIRDISINMRNNLDDSQKYLDDMVRGSRC